MRRNWKRAAPTSLANALQLCVDFARDRHNLSMERIADGMGLPSVNTLYKWLSSGRMPANMIRPFENACHCQYVTQYIASSAHKLVCDMPKAKASASEDILALQESFTTAVSTLARFYRDGSSPDETLAQLTKLMTDVASHRHRVEQYAEPELELFGEDE